MDLKYTQRSLGLLGCGRRSTDRLCVELGVCAHLWVLETFVISQGAGCGFQAHRVCARGNF